MIIQIAIFLVTAISAYYVGRLFQEQEMEELKTQKKRIYGMLTELRKQYAAKQQRKKPEVTYQQSKVLSDLDNIINKTGK